MAMRRRVSRKKRRRRKSEDEERVKPRSVGPAEGDRLGLAVLQQQVGNRAVQRMLAQRQGQAADQTGRQAEEKERAAKAQVEAGEVKIERPKIEYYDVSGDNLTEVTRQLLPKDKWYQYDYRYRTKTENGVVTRVDVTVTVTVQLPRWTGLGWEQASDFDKLEWLRMLQLLDVDQDVYRDVTKLSQQWLLGPDWKKAPDTVKGQWRAMLQALQTREQTYVDIVRRRVLVLQQRLLNQPEAQVKAVFEQFTKDVKIEQEMYNRQTEFGQKSKVSLGASTMLQ